MKQKLLLLILATSCIASLLNAQKKVSIQVEAGSGYKIYKYELSNYGQASAIPYYGRLAIRIGLLEAGGEYSADASSLTYFFEDPNTAEERFTEKHKQSYYGGFIGINSSKGDKTGMFVRVGAGMNNLTRNTVLTDGRNYSSEKLKAVLELKGMAGVAIKLTKILFLNIEGMYGMIMKRKKSDFAADRRTKDSDEFKITSYGGLMGISVHF